jgi:hypothetical protein
MEKLSERGAEVYPHGLKFELTLEKNLLRS